MERIKSKVSKYIVSPEELMDKLGIKGKRIKFVCSNLEDQIEIDVEE